MQKNGFGEKINFDELVAEFRVPDKDAFLNYITYIYKVIYYNKTQDLSLRSDDKAKGINKFTFTKVLFYKI
jgi:hypothetical protein